MTLLPETNRNNSSTSNSTCTWTDHIPSNKIIMIVIILIIMIIITIDFNAVCTNVWRNFGNKIFKNKIHMP